MTETRCPNGHLSSQSDYCDVCGARIEPATGLKSQPAPSSPPSGEAAATSPSGSLPCPRCGTVNTRSDKFCEGCGLSFAAPAARTPGATPPAPGPSPAPAPGAGEVATTGWVAIVTADHEFYARTDAGEIEFPADCPERRVPLIAEQATIGRRSESRTITPDIDLAGPPEDIGVSHEHATLTRDPGGAWLLTDRGSTNGTFRNDDQAPIAPGEPTVLGDGDRIHLGAWTTITLARVGPDGPSSSVGQQVGRSAGEPA
jgi:FHA domain/Double zinc ribbon